MLEINRQAKPAGAKQDRGDERPAPNVFPSQSHIGHELEYGAKQREFHGAGNCSAGNIGGPLIDIGGVMLEGREKSADEYEEDEQKAKAKDHCQRQETSANESENSSTRAVCLVWLAFDAPNRVQ